MEAKLNQKVYFQVACKKILGLATNFKGFRWSFNQCATIDSEKDYKECLVRLTLYLENDAALLQKFPPDNLATHYLHFQGYRGEDRVFFQRLFSGKFHFLLVAEGLSKGEPIIYANPRYYRYVRIRLMNLHSLNFLLTDIAAFQLLRNKLAALHCSALKKDDKTVVIFAPSNTGKTLSIINACSQYDAFFIAEDMAITDGKMILGVPWTSTFYHYPETERSLRSQIYRHLVKIFPPIMLSRRLGPKVIPITSIIGPERICENSKVTHLIILERRKDSITYGRREEVYRKVLNLNRCEYNYIRSPLLMAYEFLNPELDINTAYETEAAILRRLVDEVDECMVVSASEPMEFASKIIQAIS